MVGGRVRRPSQKAIEAAEAEQTFRKAVSKSLAPAEPEAEVKAEKDEAFQAPENDNDGPVKKRQATTRRNSKHQGVLKQFFELPVEIATSILSYCDHRDLFNLTFLNKQFREFMLSETAAPAWEEAEAELGDLLELDAPMTRMQLAHLLHSKQCCFCDRNDVKRRTWALKRVICPTCLKTKTCRPNQLYLNISRMHPLTQGLIEQLHFSRSRFGYSCSYDWHRVVSLPFARWLDDTLKTDHPVPENVIRDSHGPIFDFHSCTWCSNRGGATTPQATTDFAKRILKAKAAARKDAQKFEDWQRKRDNEDREKIEAAKEERKRGIKQRLLELGWTQEDFDTHWRFNPPRFVVHTAPVTDANLKKALPALEQWVTPFRQQRHAKHLESVKSDMRVKIAKEIYPVYRAQAKGPLFLPVNAFLILPAVKPFWEASEEVANLDLSKDESQAINTEALEATRTCKVNLVAALQAEKRDTIRVDPALLSFVEKGSDIPISPPAKDMTDAELDAVLVRCDQVMIRLAKGEQYAIELFCRDPSYSNAYHGCYTSTQVLGLPAALAALQTAHLFSNALAFHYWTQALEQRDPTGWSVPGAGHYEKQVIGPLSWWHNALRKRIEQTADEPNLVQVLPSEWKPEWLYNRDSWSCSCGFTERQSYYMSSNYPPIHHLEKEGRALSQRQSDPDKPGNLLSEHQLLHTKRVLVYGPELPPKTEQGTKVESDDVDVKTEQ